MFKEMENSFNLKCPINNLSYGYHGQNLIKNLLDISNVHLDTIGKIEYESQNETYVKRGMENPKHEKTVTLYHASGLDWDIGFTVFELNSFLPEELEILKRQRAIIVPTEWAKTIVESHVNVPVYVAPMGVDTDLFKVRYRKPNSQPIFIHIGKFEKRKGQDFLVDCLLKADVDCELWMICDNCFMTKEEENRVKCEYRQKLGGKVKFIPRQESQENIARLISRADFGLFPSRAEGWNLGLMECMISGLPCITTNYSAHTEYCTPENSYLIPIDKLEYAYDGKWFFRQGEWAYLGKEEENVCIEYIRKLCAEFKSSSGVIRIPQEQLNKLSNYNWMNHARKLHAIVTGI